jgi:uncharacterized protein (TIGR02001 family)
MTTPRHSLPIATTIVALFALALPATPAKAQVTGSVAFLTDYVWRGVSQTLEEPALQGELRYTHANSGFYIGAWASNVDFVPSGGLDDDADLEIDGLIGISRKINDNTTWGAGFTYYYYPGTAPHIDYDWLELNLSLGYRWLTFGLNYSDDVIASDEDGIEYVLSGSFPLAEKLTLGATVAHWDLDDALGDSYSRWEARLAYDLEAVVIAISYHDTDSSGEDLFGDNAGERVVLGVSRSF